MIAAYGDRVVMDETLAGALAALFKENAPAAPPAGAPARTGLAGPEADRAQEALRHYNGAIQQLKSGNWAGLVRNWTRGNHCSRS